MRTIAAILMLGSLAAGPVAARGQTSILPPAATLNPRADAPNLHDDALNAHGEVANGLTGGLAAGAPRVADRGRRGEGRPPRGRTCFNQAEARETIAVHRLIDPVRALRTGRQQGDALSARLCRWEPEQFIYEINVLRHDGRILHLFMNALSGEAVNGSPQAVQAGGRAPDKDR